MVGKDGGIMILVGVFVGVVVMSLLAANAEDVLNEKQHVDSLSGNCPRCGEKLRNFGRVNYCWHCGQKLRWDGEIL